MMKAITVRQPWAWAIMNAGKDIENRTWNTRLRGKVAIHAAQGMTHDGYENGCKYIERVNLKIRVPAYEELPRGAVIGTIEITDCVRDSESPWFEGDYGFAIARPKRQSEPIPCKGGLSFWNVLQSMESRIKKGSNTSRLDGNTIH